MFGLVGLLLVGCGDEADDSAPAGGGASSTAPTGGSVSSGGTEAGTGATTGGAESGGSSSGGASSASGGDVVATGGLMTGGAPAGGLDTGGATTGGASAGTGGVGTGTTGSAPAGGFDTGGATTGGASAGSGGTDPGGAAAGGDVGTGGSSTGGAGTCQESTCGSHKWACWPMPNPAGSPETVPNRASYTDLGNGAVRDDITCLVWEKANPAQAGNWQASYDRCQGLAASGFAGFDDWRLPTRVEMASITDVTRGSTGYASIFEVTSGYYTTKSFWYHTIELEGYDQVWGYGTNGFTSNNISQNGDNLVARCVRGNGSGEAADELAREPPNHYTIGTDTVTDGYTGLTWQRGRSPSLMAWEDAPAYCGGLTLDGLGGWRVPTLTELATTVNEAKVGGAIVASAFPDNPDGCREPQYWFWAAEASQVGGVAWGLSYCDGFTGWNVGSEGDWNYFPTANVRCVR